MGCPRLGRECHGSASSLERLSDVVTFTKLTHMPARSVCSGEVARELVL
jgi:hypothetical protein